MGCRPYRCCGRILLYLVATRLVLTGTVSKIRVLWSYLVVYCDYLNCKNILVGLNNKKG